MGEREGRLRRLGRGGSATLVEAIAPRPLEHGDTTVECHLFDDDALAEADRRKAERVAFDVSA